ncbi:MAG: hypothetical protein WC755_06700 [Candidatus Woesearchaeota archaeon]|jgi:hypothetical protein
MNTPIFSKNDIMEYSKVRLTSNEVPIEKIDTIVQHNGILPNEVISLYEQTHGKNALTKLNQKNPREPLYYYDKQRILVIPQYSSEQRAKRYEVMIKSLSDIMQESTGRKINYENMERENKQNVTSIAYDNFAHDFIVRMFVNEERYEPGRIFENHTIHDISKIIFGPLLAVGQHRESKVICKGKSEYLDSQIVEIGGEKILNLGYVFGSQGGILVSKLTRELAAIAKMQGKRKNINIYMFGRVGALDDSLNRHDIITPNGIIDWPKLRRKDSNPVHITNVLSKEKCPNFIFNVPNVLEETKEQLELGRQNNCSCVEMENYYMVHHINMAQSNFDDYLNISYGFAGHISDLPLKGDNLATEKDCNIGEKDAVSVIINDIKKRQ